MPMVGGRLQLLPKNIRYEFIFSAPMWTLQGAGDCDRSYQKTAFLFVKDRTDQCLWKNSSAGNTIVITCMVPMIFMGVTEAGGYGRSTIDAVRKKYQTGNEMTVRGIGTILDISGGGASVYIQSNSLARM